MLQVHCSDVTRLRPNAAPPKTVHIRVSADLRELKIGQPSARRLRAGKLSLALVIEASLIGGVKMKQNKPSSECASLGLISFPAGIIGDRALEGAAPLLAPFQKAF